ncbi:MAG TPA: hypothetical protein VF040_13035 [Ktedonobacterales bacterium]
MTSHVEEQKRAPDVIPWDTARQLCTTIQARNRRRWFTPNGMMCRGCVRFSGGDPAKMCFASKPDNRGCYQVNALYDRQFAPTSTNQ